MMKNKWFLWMVKLVAFILLFIAIDRVVGLGVKTIDTHTPTFDKLQWIMHDTKADVVLIGASEMEHSYVSRVFMDSLNVSVYNCGLDGRFLPSQTIVANTIIDRHSPKLIIWSVSPQFFTPFAVDNDRLSSFKPYYRENKWCKELLDNRSWSESIKMLSYCYTYNGKIMDYLKNLYRSYNEDDGFGYEPITDSTTRPVYDEKTWEDQPDSSYVSLFEKTLVRIKCKNIPVIFVYTPHFSYGDYKDLKGNMLLNEIIKENGCVLLEDYFHHPDLMKDYYFKDRAHLNSEGAMAFSKMLAHDLKSIVKIVDEK